MMSADAIREVLHALLDDPRFSDHLASEFVRSSDLQSNVVALEKMIMHGIEDDASITDADSAICGAVSLCCGSTVPDSRVVFFLLYFLDARPRSYAFLERFQELLRGSRFEATVFDIVRERVSRLMFDAKNRS